MVDFLIKGGVILWVILSLSIVGIAEEFALALSQKNSGR